MSPSQWIFYFAAELVATAPRMTFPKAIAFGRASRQDANPEETARAVAKLLAPALPQRHFARARTRVRRMIVLH